MLTFYFDKCLFKRPKMLLSTTNNYLNDILSIYVLVKTKVYNCLFHVFLLYNIYIFHSNPFFFEKKKQVRNPVDLATARSPASFGSLGV